jgi:radical SAM superfamily enzyme YgiQ (UPF0313 family)
VSSSIWGNSSLVIKPREHALATADIINQIRPKYLAAMTVTPVPGTVLYQEVQNGEFQVLDAFETLEEMKIILENISLDDLKFVGVHASNYLPLQGTLPRDKQKMLDTVELVLNTRNHSYLRAESMRGL